jgi:hypothetical protein
VFYFQCINLGASSPRRFTETIANWLEELRSAEGQAFHRRDQAAAPDQAQVLGDDLSATRRTSTRPRRSSCRSRRRGAQEVQEGQEARQAAVQVAQRVPRVRLAAAPDSASARPDAEQARQVPVAHHAHRRPHRRRSTTSAARSSSSSRRCSASASPSATSSLTEDQLVENLTIAINFLVSLLKKHWQNVKSLVIKTTQGRPCASSESARLSTTLSLSLSLFSHKKSQKKNEAAARLLAKAPTGDACVDGWKAGAGGCKLSTEWNTRNEQFAATRIVALLSHKTEQIEKVLTMADSSDSETGKRGKSSSDADIFQLDDLDASTQVGNSNVASGQTTPASTTTTSRRRHHEEDDDDDDHDHDHIIQFDDENSGDDEETTRRRRAKSEQRKKKKKKKKNSHNTKVDENEDSPHHHQQQQQSQQQQQQKRRASSPFTETMTPAHSGPSSSSIGVPAVMATSAGTLSTNEIARVLGGSVKRYK